jgi:hypothetical protein
MSINELIVTITLVIGLRDISVMQEARPVTSAVDIAS